MHLITVFSLFLSLFSASAFAEGDPWLLGEWRITGVKFPGMSAMSEQEAEEWINQTISYETTSVKLINQICNNPIYGIEEVSANDFMATHRVSLATLEIESSSVEIREINCDSAWMGPGLTIIKAKEDAAYTTWDGGYFIMEKI